MTRSESMDVCMLRHNSMRPNTLPCNKAEGRRGSKMG